MTKKDFLALVAALPDDTLIMVPGHDHSFSHADVRVETVVKESRDYYGEDGGQDGERVEVIVVE